MNSSLDNFDVRLNFGKLDDAILLTPTQVGQVISAASTQAVYTALYRGDLPQPFIRRNRQIRWSVGQIRGHLSQQMQVFQARQAANAAGEGVILAYAGKKRGRPRKNATENVAAA